jgi:hypothetical protein
VHCPTNNQLAAHQLPRRVLAGSRDATTRRSLVHRAHAALFHSGMLYVHGCRGHISLVCCHHPGSVSVTFWSVC